MLDNLRKCWRLEERKRLREDAYRKNQQERARKEVLR
jgi:hypothetical protein